MIIVNKCKRLSIKDIDKIQNLLKNISMVKHNIKLIICDENTAGDFYKIYVDNSFPGIESHRAICAHNGKRCIIGIYFTQYETIESITWLIIHELTHFAIRESGILDLYFLLCRDDFAESLSYNPTLFAKDYNLHRQDEIHENIPEEAFANSVATKIIGKNYDRKWWREQIKLIKGA